MLLIPTPMVRLKPDATLLLALLTLLPGTGLAQTAEPPAWDFTAAAGLFEGRPGNAGAPPYGDNWYDTVRGGVSVGRYWTTNLKTEVEVMTSGEGTRYSYRAQEYLRLSQGSARVVWQFFDNQWIHPYVLAGVTVDADRRRTFVLDQYPRAIDPRGPIVPPRTVGPDTSYQAGAIAGAGAKLYMSPRLFANTGVLVTQAKRARTVSIVFGLGLDF